MTDIENKLSAALYRVTCPDSAELGEYRLGMIPGARVAFIEQHLRECPHCKREMSQLDAFMAQVKGDLDYSTADRIKIWIARRVPDSEAGLGSPAPAFAFRGDDGFAADSDNAATTPGRSLIFEAGDAQLMLEIQDDPGDGGRKTLIGLVIGIDLAGLVAHLWLDGRQVASAAVDDLGNFAFPKLATGNYELIVTGPDAEIHVQELLT
jgi:hypothetical protein